MSPEHLRRLCVAGRSMAEDAVAGQCWAGESTAIESGTNGSAMASAQIKFLSTVILSRGGKFF